MLVTKITEENLYPRIPGKHKVLEEIRPHGYLKIKYFIQAALVCILAIGFIMIIFIPIGLDELGVIFLYTAVLPWIALGIGIVYSLALVLLNAYTNVMLYTLTTHEIIVEKGIITKSRKVVPYRNITNFNQKRGPFDRLIGGSDYGTIAIETAGMAGQQNHPEQRLEGIPNTSVLTERLRAILSKMKGQAAVTSDSEIASSMGEEELLTEILMTLKDISKKL